MLNILCDVIHDVIEKHVQAYVWRVWLIGKSDSFGNDCSAGFSYCAKGEHTEQYFD